MAASRLRSFYSYINRCFRINNVFHFISDNRRSPLYSKEIILWSWLWGFSVGMDSTEALQRLLKPAGLQRWLSVNKDLTISADVLGDALEKIAPLALEQAAHKLFLRSNRMGQLKDGGPAGLRAAAIDMTEFFCSEHLHCEHCQVREKTVKRHGEEYKVKEYYHRAVQLVLIGYDVPWPLGWELLGPGEGETTAAIRLLDRVLPKLRCHLDVVVGDGLYMCRPFWKCLRRHNLAGLAYMTREEDEPYQELELYCQQEKPQVPASFKEEGLIAWELESGAWANSIGSDLRLCRIDRIYYLLKAKHENQRQYLRFATTLPKEEASLSRLRTLAKARWEQENSSFWYLKTKENLSHNYHHHVNTIANIAWLASLAMALMCAFGRFRRRYGETFSRVRLQEELLAGLHQLAGYKDPKEEKALQELWEWSLDALPP